jgi:hypothetical protein
MGDNDIKFEKNNKLSPKLNLCYYVSLSQSQKSDENNPIINLLSNFNEITSILNIYDLNCVNFLYLNSSKVNKILYDCEEIIEIKNKNEDTFIFYIILSLLIEENLNVVNYSYSKNLINKLHQEQMKLKNEKIKKIIIAKIIIELISNYDNDDNYDEKNEIDLGKIENYNNKTITDNIKELQIFELTEKEILNKKMDEIYSKIIKYFIVNKKLDDSDDYTENIFKQIDLKSLNLTQLMFDDISKLLDENKDYLTDFIIKEYDDLFNTQIINFYYTLLRYIIKNNADIYRIQFLSETRNKIKKLVKTNLNKFYNTINSKKDEKIKIEFYLGAFIEYKYYLKRSLIEIRANENNSSINSSYINSVNINRNNNDYGMNNNISVGGSQNSGFFSGSSYKNEKEKSQRSLDVYDVELRSEFYELETSCKDDPIFKILSKSSFKFEFYKKQNNNINYKCCEIIIKDKIVNKSLDEIKKDKSDNEILNNNYEKFLKVFKFIIDKIKEEIPGNIDFAVTLIFIGNTIKNSIFQIDCTYKLEKKNKNASEFMDNGILETEPFNGINFLIDEIKG